MRELVATFRYLHSKNIFHRDIKPENILIADNFKPLLIDFGLAIDYHHATHSFVGTYRYAAP